MDEFEKKILIPMEQFALRWGPVAVSTITRDRLDQLCVELAVMSDNIAAFLDDVLPTKKERAAVDKEVKAEEVAAAEAEAAAQEAE